MIFDVSSENIPGKDPVSIARFAARAQVGAESCGKWSGDFTKFISTAYTARDMDLIREALGEDKLNYFGFSYGLFWGLLIPELIWIGRLRLHDMETVLDAFGAECEAVGPIRCALANLTATTTPSVATLVRKTLQSLETNPIPVLDADVPSIVNQIFASQVVMMGMYRPTSWTLTAQALADVIVSGDPRLLLQMGGGGVSAGCPVEYEGFKDSMLAVKCADGKGDKEITLEMWEEGSSKVEKLSPLAGRGWTYGGLACKWWPGEPVERYDGPWNHTLSNKVLLVGNTLDPATPLSSAKVAERVMGGYGVLLTQDGYGHCSLAQSSSCTLSLVEKYFAEGQLPEPGHICKTDIPVFPGKNAFGGLSLEATAMSLEVDELHQVLVKEQFQMFRF
ncbi:hypothetical protein HDU76_000865 [Blyttiomyces sp. JEL0837]|nr:hypothetical protein HDU76_000865 [Blyttiomyces sp. JEL0837]